MRALLIRPPSILGRIGRQNLQHPTNIVGLASELNAHGHQAAVLDLEVTPGGWEALAAVLRETAPGLVGVSLVTPHVPGAAALLAATRRLLPDVFLIAGGPHATALPDDLLDEIPELDAICIGEGDESLVELCDALSGDAQVGNGQGGNGQGGNGQCGNGQGGNALGGRSVSVRGGSGGAAPFDAARELQPLASITGLVLREVGHTGWREPIADLDRLAPLDRSLLDWAAYERVAGRKGVASPGVIRKGIRATQVHLSRGCYARCVFCSTNAVWGERARPGIRRRSVPAVLEEIDRLMADEGINHINFEDDIFPPTLNYLEELGQALIQRPITWSCNARVDGLQREHFELMAASGCQKIDFGVESGSERILELNKKLVTRDRVVTVFAEAKRAGILRTAYLMLGSHVDETPEEVELTWQLAKQIEPDYITYTVACPYPGTELWEECKRRGYLVYEADGRPDWRRYGYYPGLPPWRFTHFSAEEMLATQKRFLRRFYLDPRFMLRMLGRLRGGDSLAALWTAGIDVTSFLFGDVGRRLRRPLRGPSS